MIVLKIFLCRLTEQYKGENIFRQIVLNKEFNFLHTDVRTDPNIECPYFSQGKLYYLSSIYSILKGITLFILLNYNVAVTIS